MKPGWTTFACGIVLGGALGFAAGYVVLSSRLPHEGRGERAAWTAFDPNSTLPDLLSDADGPIGDDWADREPVYFPDAAPAGGQTVNADGVSVVREESGAAAPGNRAPATLPAGHDALPLDAADSDHDQLQELLDEELAGVPPEDRDVWRDVLRGLPAEDALGILRLWKRFGTRTSEIGPSETEPARQFSSPPSARPLTDAGRPIVDRRTAALVARLHAARDILVENLLNSRTPGFRRSELMLFPVDRDVLAIGASSPLAVSVTAPPDEADALASARIDLTPGPLRYTSRPLDVAVDGSGYFVVRHQNRIYYTRCGRFVLDESRRLALADTAAPLVLQPEIVLPQDAHGLAINQAGEVSVAGGDDPHLAVVGNITLATFIDPTELTPAGGALFVSGPGSGPPSIGRPTTNGRGMLLQHYLESSNAPFEQELKRIEEIDTLLELLAE